MKPSSDRMPARGFRSLSPPSLGAFRLSLTVLRAIGHRLVFSLGGWAPRIRPGFRVPWATPEPETRRRRPQGALTRCGQAFQNSSGRPRGAHDPACPASLRFGLLPLRSPLLRESRLISFPPGTGMFRFPGFAPHRWGPRLVPGGLSHSGARGSKAGAPRPGVSPLPAPFIAGLCLGIPRVRCSTCPGSARR